MSVRPLTPEERIRILERRTRELETQLEASRDALKIAVELMEKNARLLREEILKQIKEKV